MTNGEHRSDILVVGSVAFDSIETPSGSVEKVLGGSATFASVAASYFARPRVVAVVGGDFGADHRALLERRGIDTRGIEAVKDGKTFHWKGRYHDNLKDRDTLETCLHVFADFDPVLSPPLRKSSHVFLGNIGPGLQGKVLDQVEAPSFVGIDTMNLWISEALADLREVLRRVDVLFVNDDESYQLTGERQVLNAARAILTLGPEYVVIKRGEYGALLFGNELCLFVPAVLLPGVVDPTGAGDAFAGGFMGFVAGAGEVTPSTLARAMRAGSVMASFACEAFSVDRLVRVDASEIERRMAFLQSMSG
jgi:sugar/nucleoside kinase (ribokinase family)